MAESLKNSKKVIPLNDSKINNLKLSLPFIALSNRSSLPIFTPSSLPRFLLKPYKEVSTPSSKQYEEASDYFELILPILSKRMDFLFPMLTPFNEKTVNHAVLISFLSSILKSLDTIRKNDKKLSGENDKSDSDGDEEIKDSGFHRPKLLILTPFQKNACDLIDSLLSILSEQYKVVDNKKRFRKEYNPVKEKREYLSKKPADYRNQFEGSSNDNFKMGISIEPNHIKLFSDFYKSDIIVASPLALSIYLDSLSSAEKDLKEDDTDLNSENDGDFSKIPENQVKLNKKRKAEDLNENQVNAHNNKFDNGQDLGNKFRNADFLCSIESVFVHKADLMLMQNWEHLVHVCRSLNNMPKSSKNIDFFRVKDYLINGEGKKHCQLVITSGFMHPKISSLFASSLNVSGVFKVKPLYDKSIFSSRFFNFDKDTSKNSYLSGIKQVFVRFKVDRINDLVKNRKEFFIKNILESFLDSDTSNVMVYISEYFDFISLRNYFSRKELSFDFCSEHSTVGDNNRALNAFVSGKIRFLLITERFHFFRRLQLKGSKTILFYDLPTFPHFYTEILKSINTEKGSVCALFCCYDGQKIERILGTDKKIEIFNSNGETFLVN